MAFTFTFHVQILLALMLTVWLTSLMNIQARTLPAKYLHDGIRFWVFWPQERKRPPWLSLDKKSHSPTRRIETFDELGPLKTMAGKIIRKRNRTTTEVNKTAETWLSYISRVQLLKTRKIDKTNNKTKLKERHLWEDQTRHNINYRFLYTMGLYWPNKRQGSYRGEHLSGMKNKTVLQIRFMK